MKIKCEYCSSYFDDELENCPNCGCINNNIRRTSTGVPRTIEELKQWCVDKNIPYEKLGFRIGEDYRGPKAFGIYQNLATGNYVVYKQKLNATRAIRYEGKDEAYAVYELYLKIKEVAALSAKPKQKQNKRIENPNIDWREINYYKQVNKRKSLKDFGKTIFSFFLLLARWYIIIMMIITPICGMISCSESLYYNVLDSDKGYYKYQDDTYYRYKGNWYRWESDGRYWDYEANIDFEDNYKDYFDTNEYNAYFYEYSDFEDSDHYNSFLDDDSDWGDDDWDYDYDYDTDWDYDYDYDWDSDW